MTTTDEKMALLIAETEKHVARMPKAMECPPWCELRDRIAPVGSFGHAWYDTWTSDPDVFSRFHEVSFGGWSVSREETVRDGVGALGPVEIGYGGDTGPMSIDGARYLAADLRAAIIKAEEIG